MRKISLIIISTLVAITGFGQNVSPSTNVVTKTDTVDMGKQTQIEEATYQETKTISNQIATENSSIQSPRTFKYQAIARDGDNKVLADKTVSLRISIVSDSENGTLVYSETHNSLTNTQGLINLEIGGGKALENDFSDIQWGTAAYYIKVEMDTHGGNNFVEMGTTKLLAVPYALYAERAGNSSSLKSGTTSKWTTIDANSIVSDYTKVGIGTGASIPYSSLDIRGTSYLSYPSAYGTQVAQGLIELTRSSYPYIDFTTSLNTDYGARIIYFTSGDYLYVQNANFMVSGTIGVGTTTPNASAKLDVSSTSQGFLPPRMTTAQRDAIASPAVGLQVYNTTTNCLNYYTPGGWFEVCGVSTIPTVTSPTGKIWMDRNLGASQVATSSTDAASYGDLYQWGRGTDGHQLRTSGTTTTLSSTDVPGHANFILAPSTPYDWRSPQNNNLWQGVNGVNNPCPTGFRIPTSAELDAERLSWSSNNSAGAFASPLKFSMAGSRDDSNGSLGNVGSKGTYWSSTVDGAYSRSLLFDSSNALMYSSSRAFGFSVRCLKD